MRNYEVAYIADPDLDDQALAALDERVAGWIEAAGGKTVSVDRWGKRRMSYAIKGRNDGVYVFVTASLPAQAPSVVEREMRLQESILRYMITVQPGA